MARVHVKTYMTPQQVGSNLGLSFCFSGTSYSGYEAAVYSAASSYYQQQQQQQKQAVAAVAATAAWTGNTFSKKPPFQNKQLRPKQPPKPPQIHYCDVCKISCAGPQVSSIHPTIHHFCQESGTHTSSKGVCVYEPFFCCVTTPHFCAFK